MPSGHVEYAGPGGRAVLLADGAGAGDGADVDAGLPVDGGVVDEVPLGDAVVGAGPAAGSASGSAPQPASTAATTNAVTSLRTVPP